MNDNKRIAISMVDSVSLLNLFIFLSLFSPRQGLQLYPARCRHLLIYTVDLLIVKIYYRFQDPGIRQVVDDDHLTMRSSALICEMGYPESIFLAYASQFPSCCVYVIHNKLLWKINHIANEQISNKPET